MALYPSDTPVLTAKSWRMVPLYFVSKTGAVMFWEVTFDVPSSTLSTYSGTLIKKALSASIIGKNNTRYNNALNIPSTRDEVVTHLNAIKAPFVTEYAVAKAKSKVITPKRNLSVMEQGILECRSLRKKHCDTHGATDDLDAILANTHEAPFRVQLAHVYCFPGHIDHDPKHISKAQWEVGIFAQTKEDGNHLVMYERDGTIVAETRKGLAVSWLYGIKGEVAKLLAHLPTGTYVDGEITHPDGLQALRTVMGRSKTRNVEGEDLLVYNIFDIYIPPREESMGYTLQERLITLQNAYDAYTASPLDERTEKRIVLLPSTKCHSVEELKTLFDEVIAQGKEGLIIRKCAGGPLGAPLADSLYIPGGRTSNMLKVKPFEDAEGIIIDVEAGSGTHAGCAIFVIEMSDGKVFRINAHGTIEEKRTLYDQRATCIGRIYKYAFTGTTNDGLPREARGIDFRDDGI